MDVAHRLAACAYMHSWSRMPYAGYILQNTEIHSIDERFCDSCCTQSASNSERARTRIGLGEQLTRKDFVIERRDLIIRATYTIDVSQSHGENPK